MAIVKPDLSQQWASDGDKIAPSGAKIQAGWGPEIPPYQWENFIQNRQDEMLAYLNERGVPEWDNRTNYVGGGKSYVQGSDGVVYKSVAASGPSTITQDPVADTVSAYWTIAFASTAQATETVRGTVELATTVEAQTGTDDVRAMTPLKVKQAIDQFGSDFINTTRINVASASTVNLTTLAPNTRHIRLTGAATINNFTIQAGQFYFVTVGAAQTIVNSASIVTQNGANMAVVAGDTYCVGATANNVVYVWGWSKVSQVVNQTFTASGNFTAPFTGTYYLSGCGGGGNGGVGGSSGGGGSGAQCLNYPVSLTAGQVVAVTVGGIGGTTSFGATLTMTGGQDGTSTDGGLGGTVTVGAGPSAFNGVKGGYRAAAGIPGGGGQSLYGLAGTMNNGSDTDSPSASGYGAGAAGKTSGTNQGIGTPGILMIRGQR